MAGELTPGRTLDIGCGTGSLTAELMRRGHDVVSQDASPAIADLCRRHLADQGLPTEQVRTGLIEDIDAQERYDNVVALDVIERIEDDAAAVRAMHDAARARRHAAHHRARGLAPLRAEGRRHRPSSAATTATSLAGLLRSEGMQVQSLRWWNLIGVPAVWLTGRVLKRRLAEDFRYGDRSWAQRRLNDAQRAWFQQVEARMRPPIGLTLIACAKRSNG